MRYSSNHKQNTRSNLIEVAAKLFKTHGTDATGLATIMKEAGLTNGAFYAHFNSKDALVEAVIERQLTDQLAQFRKELGGIDGLKRVIDIYLSDVHVASCADGCPSAALLGEVSKRDESTRKVYTDGLSSIIREISDSVNATSEQDRRVLLSVFGLLIGTVQLARTVTDRNLSRNIIEGGHESAYKLLSDTFRK